MALHVSVSFFLIPFFRFSCYCDYWRFFINTCCLFHLLCVCLVILSLSLSLSLSLCMSFVSYYSCFYSLCPYVRMMTVSKVSFVSRPFLRCSFFNSSFSLSPFFPIFPSPDINSVSLLSLIAPSSPFFCVLLPLFCLHFILLSMSPPPLCFLWSSCNVNNSNTTVAYHSVL